MNSAYTSSSLAYTVAAPCSPRVAAASVAPGPRATAATSPSRSRALVSSSSAPGSTFPPGLTSAYTQMPPISDHLGFCQEGDDAVHALLGVLDDLAGALLRRRVHRGHLLGRRSVVAGEPEVRHGELVHRLLLGLHDALQGGVPGLGGPGGDRDHRGKRGLHGG